MKTHKQLTVILGVELNSFSNRNSVIAHKQTQKNTHRRTLTNYINKKFTNFVTTMSVSKLTLHYDIEEFFFLLEIMFR